MVDLTETQKEVLRAVGHQLVTGEPGSGKTTVAILKGAKIAREALNTGRKVYDLVLERKLLSKEQLDEILKPEVLTRPRQMLKAARD